jgi:sterol desaturase/sphingolipid hydroxylase (fatty acid hydroxylase superfamily)
MRLSNVAYFGDFVGCPVAILAMGCETIPRQGFAAVAGWLAAAAAGVIAWTLLEYAIHRWIYHRWLPFKRYHDMHHAEPEAQVGAPSFISIALILAFVGAPLCVFGIAFAGAVTTGVLIGYAGYILVHHAVHHWKPAAGSPFYGLRRLHARHHYAPMPSNFGVTTSFWDRVFGTLFVEPRRVPTA